MGKYAESTGKKRGNKGFVIFLAVLLVLLAALAAAGVWVTANYHIVSGKLYEKDAAVLDLREEDMTPARVDKIRQKMPDCEIRWNIPFQGGTLSDDVKEITITALTQEDIVLLDYARQLQTVQAEGCTDYAALAHLRQHRPELQVNYRVAFSGGSYAWNVETLVLNSVTEADIHLLKHLPNLKTVALGEGTYDTKTVEALRGSVHNAGLQFGVILGGEICSDARKSLEIEGITDGELALLPHLSGLENLLLQNPAADPEKVFALQKQLPGVAVSWEVTLGEQTYAPDTKAVDLTMVEI